MPDKIKRFSSQGKLQPPRGGGGEGKGLNKMGRGAVVIFWGSKFDKVLLFGSLPIEVIFVGLKRIPLYFFFWGGGGLNEN